MGYGEGSGYALLTPEEAGGDLTYERMEDIDLGRAQARRWRYTDAGSRWDFLAAEAGGFFFSIMVAVPEESAEALDEEVEALIASLSLRAEDTDDNPMLGADTSGFTLVMDTLAGDADGMGRATATSLWTAAYPSPSSAGRRTPTPSIPRSICAKPSPGRTRNGWRTWKFPATAPSAGALP